MNLSAKAEDPYGPVAASPQSPLPDAPRSVPSSPANRLWVIIVTHNGAEWVGDCLRSVMCSLVEQVIVIDNASTDSTLEIVRSLQLPVQIVSLPSNVGFGRANNIAIQRALRAGAKYVLLLNQDAVIEEASLSRLCWAMDTAPQFGILSAVWLDYSGSGIDPLFRRLMTPEFWDDLYLGRLAPIYDTGVVPAACAILRTAVLDSVGGFDPLFFMYNEDDDLCYRASSAGWRVGFVPHATVRHWHAQIQKTFPFKMQLERQYSAAVFRLKTSPRPVVLRYLGLIRWWFPMLTPERPRVTLILIRFLVFVRCLRNARAILRSRSLSPGTIIERYDPSLIAVPQADGPDVVRP